MSWHPHYRVYGDHQHLHHDELIRVAGLQFDRQFVITDPTGHFLTLRQHASLALVQPELHLNDNGELERLSIHAPAMPTITVTLASLRDTSPTPVTVWKDTVDGFHCGDDVARWFSEYLGTSAQLMYKGPKVRSIAHQPTAPHDTVHEPQVAYADGYPMLVLGTASLDDLNTRLPTSVTMKHFRPNVVVQTTEPYVEDTWHRVKVGENIFHMCKLCGRCTVPNINHDTGEKEVFPVLKTLMKYRRIDPTQKYQACFGRMAAPILLDKTIQIGQEVSVFNG
jgi:hypothetical protein